MSLRETFNKNPALISLIALLVLGGSAVFLTLNHLRKADASGLGQPVYFYDLGTGERFVGSLRDHPPIEAPSGPDQGVRVYVYGCGSCDEADLMNVYLEKLTPEGKEAAIAKAPLTDMKDVQEATRLAAVIANNTLHRAADGGEWFPAQSAAARELRQNTGRLCPEGNAIPCRPGQKGLRI